MPLMVFQTTIKRKISPHCFQREKLSTDYIPSLTLSQTSLGFTFLQYKSFENAVGKGEIARNEQFLLFPLCFLPLLENFLLFSLNLKLSSANSVWKSLKFVIWERVNKVLSLNRLTEQINFRLLCNERTRSQQIKNGSDNEIYPPQGSGKHCEIRRKCWLPGFSPFPTFVFKSLCH